MEKKGSRSLAPSASKGPANDSKKLQDGAGGKVWPRGGRRREPIGGSPATKVDSSRKPPSQRNKAFVDKRPKSRGTFMARTETPRVEEEFEAELGSVFIPGSKKQSLNHLLNFVYTPYANEARHHVDSGTTNKAHRLINTRKHKFKKEDFLQANCQFIVNALGDYTMYMKNPDTIVDWSLVEQVHVQVTEFPSCPICLYPPVAAKMTRCGHTYCWSCVLHYLALSEENPRTCPICHESVREQDLKSVVSIPHNTFNTNDEITFKLMKKLKGSLVAYPATSSVKENRIFSLSEKEAGEIYSKLLLANHSEIMAIIDREDAELKAQLIEDEECLDNCFVVQAITLLEERRRKLLESSVGLQKTDGAGNGDGDSEIALDLENLQLDAASSSNNHQPTPKMHYFYQACDGQHIYLHAINARMLEDTYGSLEWAPKILHGKILEKEGGSMTEELRKRFRYLEHLPLTCQFEVAEIQLKQPIVAKETIQKFNEQLEIRRKGRQKRAKEEKSRERRILEDENRMLGKFPVPNLHIDSQSQFPGFEPRFRSESECTQPDDSFDLLPSTSSDSVESDHAGPSFAKMLASASKKQEVKWPALKTVTSEPLKLINVTGSKLRADDSFKVRPHSDSDEGEFNPVPSCNTCISDAIVQALQRAEKIEATSEVSTVNGKKKKKKNKQKVLFTTAVAFSGK